MATRAIKPVSVTLGPLAEAAHARVTSGHYASVSEVVRAGLRALEREEAALDAVLKARIAEAIADTSPAIEQSEVFEQLRAHHEARSKA
ncbi:MAG: type II toxin-antitoxin system ParD family antitoxin [Sphingomonadales bacterium]|nr:type II toxin-antitoxin system ParD family antitoxin [Sphingomonadales bacterium]